MSITNVSSTRRIARIFRAKRESELNVSLQTVADATGMSVATINRIETAGLLKPTFDDVITLARYYRVPIEELTGERVTPRKTTKGNTVQTLVDTVLAEAREEELDYVSLMLTAYLRHLKDQHSRQGGE